MYALAGALCFNRGLNHKIIKNKSVCNHRMSSLSRALIRRSEVFVSEGVSAGPDRNISRTIEKWNKRADLYSPHTLNAASSNTA